MSTHCDPSVANNQYLRNADHEIAYHEVHEETPMLYNGVIVGYCSNGEGKRCTNYLPDANGTVNFECINTLTTTYATSTPLWIKAGVCIRPLCKTVKRVACSGKSSDRGGARCWEQKYVENVANECQWSGCSHYGGSTADRAVDPKYCTADAALG